jgi:hypothetical protein
MRLDELGESIIPSILYTLYIFYWSTAIRPAMRIIWSRSLKMENKKDRRGPFGIYYSAGRRK